MPGNRAYAEDDFKKPLQDLLSVCNGLDPNIPEGSTGIKQVVKLMFEPQSVHFDNASLAGSIGRHLQVYSSPAAGSGDDATGVSGSAGDGVIVAAAGSADDRIQEPQFIALAIWLRDIFATNLGQCLAQEDNIGWLLGYKDLQGHLLAAIFARIEWEKTNQQGQDDSAENIMCQMVEQFNKSALAMAKEIGAIGSPEAAIALLQLQMLYQEKYDAHKNDIPNMAKPISVRALLTEIFTVVATTKAGALTGNPVRQSPNAEGVHGLEDPIIRRTTALSAYKAALEVEIQESWLDKFIAICEAFKGLRDIYETLSEYTPFAYSKKLKLSAVKYLQTSGDNEASRDKNWKDSRKEELRKVLGDDKSSSGAEQQAGDGAWSAPSELGNIVDKELKRVKKAIDQGLLGKINKQFKSAPRA